MDEYHGPDEILDFSKNGFNPPNRQCIRTKQVHNHKEL